MMVLGVGFLEAMQRRVGVVFGKSCIRLPLLGHLYHSMFGWCYLDLFTPHFQLVQVSHGCKKVMHLIKGGSNTWPIRVSLFHLHQVGSVKDHNLLTQTLLYPDYT